MATQYTDILKLALPVQGELAGNWGNTVNDEITSLVEEAVAGLAVIDTWTTNSHTLTVVEGATSEARSAILRLTDTGGALTGAGTVICPDQSKVYIVENSTGEDVTIKTSGGTGVTVRDGFANIVYCNGTNVEDAANPTFYDNSTSGLTADTLKGAIDEVVGRLETAEGNISSNTSAISTNASNIAANTNAINLRAPIANPTFTGSVTIPNYIFRTGDSNTFFGFSAEDTFEITTGGSERLRVDNSGDTMIGRNANFSGARLEVQPLSGNPAISINNVGGDEVDLRFYNSGTLVGGLGNVGNGELAFYAYGVSNAVLGTFDFVASKADGSDSTSRMSIDEDGNVTIGGTLLLNNTTITQKSVNDSVSTLSGGNASNAGANYAMFGGAHPTLANNHRWRVNGTVVMQIYGNGDIDFKNNNLLNATMNVGAISSSLTIGTPNEYLYTNTSSAITYTFSSSFPVGGVVCISNISGANVTIAAHSGGSIIWLNGSTATTGNRSLSVGGVVTVIKRSSAVYDLFGTGVS